MAQSREKTIMKYVGAIVFGLLSLCALAAVFGLGINGILVADRLNPCEQTNATGECMLEATINPDGEEEDTTPSPDERGEEEWAFWLLGSTGAAVAWALLTSASLAFVVDILHDKQKKELKRISSHEDIEMRPMVGTGSALGKEGRSEGEPEKGIEAAAGGRVTEDAGVRQSHQSGSDEPDVIKGSHDMKETREKLRQRGIKVPDVDETDHAELMIDYIGAYRVKEWHGKPLRHLGLGCFIVLFCSLLTLVMSLMSLLWAVAMGYYHTNRVEKDIGYFIAVELLAGFLLPLLLFVSFILLGVVVEYVTIGRVDARKTIKRFIPSVMFEEGADYDYWVIEERFYFKLPKRNEHLNHSVLYSCNKGLSTWILTIILALALLLCFSYFVDISVVEEETRTSCPPDPVQYDCFNRDTFDFIDCADGVQVELIHCFRFLRFAVDTNLITSFSQSFAFYLATLAIFGRVFAAVKTLLHLHRTRVWGWLLILVGAAALITALVLLIVFLVIDDKFHVRVSILSLLQACMVCMFLILVGVLVLKGDWYEKIFDNKRIAPLAQLLVHYDSISSHQVHSIEHQYAREIKEKDPTSAHRV